LFTHATSTVRAADATAVAENDAGGAPATENDAVVADVAPPPFDAVTVTVYDPADTPAIEQLVPPPAAEQVGPPPDTRATNPVASALFTHDTFTTPATTDADAVNAAGGGPDGGFCTKSASGCIDRDDQDDTSPRSAYTVANTDAPDRDIVAKYPISDPGAARQDSSRNAVAGSPSGRTVHTGATGAGDANRCAGAATANMPYPVDGPSADANGASGPVVASRSASDHGTPSRTRPATEWPTAVTV
jgi:hypothetical protein